MNSDIDLLVITESDVPSLRKTIVTDSGLQFQS